MPRPISRTTTSRTGGVVAVIGAIGLVVASCGTSTETSSAAAPTTPPPEPAATVVELTAADTSDADGHGATDNSKDKNDKKDKRHKDDKVDPSDLLPAYLGAAPFQDVEVAEAAGWVSTIETLGCFENPDEGGMGVHWLNESLLDDVVDAAQPEALVYELDAAGEVVGLVGHEYLVPVDAWSSHKPPSLFGIDFHEHPVLPFWILHTYLWKENPAGMFNDWNPAIRMCPDGVMVFGEEPAGDGE